MIHRESSNECILCLHILRKWAWKFCTLLGRWKNHPSWWSPQHCAKYINISSNIRQQKKERKILACQINLGWVAGRATLVTNIAKMVITEFHIKTTWLWDYDNNANKTVKYPLQYHHIPGDCLSIWTQNWKHVFSTVQTYKALDPAATENSVTPSSLSVHNLPVASAA